VEVSRLQPLPFLKELDLRLNPVVRKDTDYRLFAVYTLQTLEKLGETRFLSHSFPKSYWTQLPLNLLHGRQTVHRHICLSVNIYVTLCVGRMCEQYFYCLGKGHLWFYQLLPALVFFSWWFLHCFLLNIKFPSWALVSQVPSSINHNSNRSPV
jgi:hypothetical protein